MTTVSAPAPASGRIASRLPVLRPLAERDFRLLWAGESISLLGDQFHFVALATLVFALTGSGLALGTVLIAAAVPRAGFMLLGGALTDRLSPRALMIGSNLARGATVGVVAVLVLADSVELWHLVALGIVFGTVDSIFFPALNTIVPMLVPLDRLPAANAVVQGTSQFMGLVGPAVAGIVVAAMGTGTAFTLDALSFGVAALALFLIRGGRRTTKAVTAGPAVSEPSLARSIRDGAAYAFRDTGIRSIILLSAAVNLGTSGSIAVGLPWLANVRFDGGPALLGVLFAGFGAGALAGAIIGGTAAHPGRFGLVVLALAAGLGLGIAALGIAPNAAVAIAILVLAGITAGYLNVTIIAWLQARADPALLGRVMSLVMLGAVGLQPVSLALAGILVDAHATAMYVAAGAVILAAVAVGLLGGAQRALD